VCGLESESRMKQDCVFCLMSWCLSWRSWCAAALSVKDGWSPWRLPILLRHKLCHTVRAACNLQQRQRRKTAAKLKYKISGQQSKETLWEQFLLNALLCYTGLLNSYLCAVSVGMEFAVRSKHFVIPTWWKWPIHYHTGNHVYRVHIVTSRHLHVAIRTSAALYSPYG
jgi:hypothetical protein